MHGRIDSIQYIRGIAALLVAWFHFTVSSANFLAPGFLKSTGTYGWTGVQMFFVISGFVLPYSLFVGRFKTREFGRFALKRIIRLEPPYLVSIALTAAVAFAAAVVPGYRGGPPGYTVPQIASHLGYLVELLDYRWINPVYWTLAIEFQFYLLVGLLFPLVSSPKRWVRLATLAALTASAWTITPQKFVFPFLFFFMIGFVAFQYRTRLIGPIEAAVTALTIATIGSFRQDPAGIIAALIAALIIATVGEVRFGHSVLMFLGDISYSLYLIHVPVGGRVVNLGERLGGGVGTKLAVLTVALAVTLVAAYLMYRLVEKPFQLYASSIKYGARPAVVVLADPPVATSRT